LVGIRRQKDRNSDWRRRAFLKSEYRWHLVAITTEDENVPWAQLGGSKRVCQHLHSKVYVSLLLYAFLTPHVEISLVVIALVKTIDDEQVADRLKCASPH
jgi:hypothetical protein